MPGEFDRLIPTTQTVVGVNCRFLGSAGAFRVNQVQLFQYQDVSCQAPPCLILDQCAMLTLRGTVRALDPDPTTLDADVLRDCIACDPTKLWLQSTELSRSKLFGRSSPYGAKRLQNSSPTQKKSEGVRTFLLACSTFILAFGFLSIF